MIKFLRTTIVSKLWFIYSNDVVTGPFSTEQVQTQLSLGQWSSNCFIWWKGQREWMPIRTWEQQLSKILKKEDENSQSPVWYVDNGGSPVGPLTQNEMITHLRSIANLGKVRLWSVGMNKWTNLFELHDIMDQLGLSRREHERAPLMGSVALTRAGDTPQTIMGKAAAISIAGMGVNGAHSLQKGDDIQLVVKSHEFAKALHLQGKVMYITPAGYCGIKFNTVHPETQSLIFDYVKKFNTPAVESDKKTA